MLKNILSKINNFIQWTKKWHFFHAFLLISSLVMLTMTGISLPYTGWIENLQLTYYFLSFFIYLFAIAIALIIQILFSIINLCIHKNIQIKNHFLLKNKIYNGIYYFMFLYTIAYFIIIVCFLLIISNK